MKESKVFQLTELENRVLNSLFRAKGVENIDNLIKKLKIKNREYTGFGFFTDFEPEIEGSELNLGRNDTIAVFAAHPMIENGEFGTVDFVLFVREGYVVLLEGACIQTWPSDEHLIIIQGAP